MTDPAPPTRWYTTQRFFILSLLLLTLVIAAAAVIGITRRDNDFKVHRAFGQAFLDGDPYGQGQAHYLPGRGLINALGASLPYLAHRAVHFGLALGLLLVSFGWWHRMAGPGHWRVSYAAAVFTLLLLGPYLLRDLDDCGLQIVLVVLLSAAAYALFRGRPLRAGCWLGLAATYKVTPFLFLLLLLWKRQWRAAAAMVACTLVLGLLPALYLGWDNTTRAYGRWYEFASECLSSPDPSATPVEPPNHRNQSLPFAIARFVQTHPPGHPLTLEHPAFVQFGSLEAGQAKRAVQGALLFLALLLAWRLRQPFGSAPADLPRQWAVAMIFCALLSPLCWLQHLVVAVPAMFLWWHARLTGQTPRWHSYVIGASALMILVVHQDLLGKELYLPLMSYKPHTLACLLLVLLLLTIPRKCQETDCQATIEDCAANATKLVGWRAAPNELWRREPYVVDPSTTNR